VYGDAWSGKGCDAGGGNAMGRSKGGGSEGRGSGVDGSVGGICVGGGSALGACSVAVRAQVFAAAERASGLACLPDCSPAPYGSSSVAHLQLGSPMCWAVSALSTFPRGRFFPRFSPIRAAVSGQVC